MYLPVGRKKNKATPPHPQNLLSKEGKHYFSMYYLHTCKGPVCATFFLQERALSAVKGSNLWPTAQGHQGCTWPSPAAPPSPAEGCTGHTGALWGERPWTTLDRFQLVPALVWAPHRAPKPPPVRGSPDHAGGCASDRGYAARSKRGALEQERLWGARRGRTRGPWLRGTRLELRVWKEARRAGGGAALGACGRGSAEAEEQCEAASSGGRGPSGGQAPHTHPDPCPARPRLTDGIGRKGT